LIDFLGYLVEKLWPKHLNMGKNELKQLIYPNFGYFTPTFEPETLESLTKQVCFVDGVCINVLYID